MKRRDALQAIAGAAGFGLVPVLNSAAASPQASRKPEIRARDGTLLFHRDWGTGKPVVFLHGWGLHSAFWEYAMAFVVDHGFRAIAFDRRSHGRSGDPGRGYDYDTLAGDVATVLDALELRGATLVGHSLGGAEAVRYLTRHGPRRVTRLVLVAATLPFLLKTDNNPGVDKSTFDALRATLGRNRAQWLADNSAPFWTPDSSPALIDWGHAMPWQSSLYAMRELTRTMSETDFRAELRSLAVPTTVIHGTADRSVPIGFGRATAQLIRGAELREYDGAPHGLPLTHMERFHTDLLSLLNKGL